MAWNCNFPLLIAQVAVEAEVEGGMSPLVKMAIAAGVIFGSFALGAFIARRLRMPDYSFKIGLLLFTFSASMAVNIAGWPPKRGIDLSGGVVLVYEVDKELSKPGQMEGIVARVNEHLNSAGGEPLEARTGPNDLIEITLPEGADPARVERAVFDLRTTADVALNNAGKRTEDGKTVLTFRVDQQQKSVDMDKLIAAVGRRINPGGVKELTIRQYGAEQLEVIIPEVDEREVDQIKKRISTSGFLEFRIVANERDDKDIIKASAKSPGRDVYIGGHLAGRWVQLGPEMKDVSDATVRHTEARGNEILVRIDPFNVDGRNLDRAASGFDQGRRAVNFSFDATGADKFGELTKRNLPDPATPDFKRRLGIILDNVMLSAPTINSAIYGDGQITGNFTQDEVDFLVGVLNAGSLPASLRPEPISQQRISSQLGDDTIRRGTESMMISTAAILIFMLVYYRFCGIVADVAVVLNMVVTVALMILIKAAFTLPGLAGLVLTVGMAVDANVLIYERMREETERGASLRMAIRNGFSRAMATIIDSHVTTLVSAMVLYVIGTDQIKGFAVTLILGLLMSLFTAVYVARVLFDIAEKKRWITQLNIMHLIGHTNIDFIRWLKPAIAISVIIIVVGLGATAMRGSAILDIDFTGGSSVQLLFADDKPQDIADVRLAVAHLPDVAVSSVGDNNLEFKVDTSERDIKKVQNELKDTFGKSLLTYEMEYGQTSTIEADKPADEAAKPGEEKTKPADEATSKPAVEEKPTETPVPATSKPAETKEPAPPAAEAPAKPEESAAPQSDKPTAPETPKAEETKSSGLLNPTSPRALRGAARFRLASVGSGETLTELALVQAESAGEAAADEKKETPAEPAQPPEPKQAEAKPADAKPEVPVTTAAEPKADDAEKPAKATEEKPAEEKPTEPASTAAPAATEEGASTASNPSLVGGTRIGLTFPQDISYGPLREMVDKELAELKLENVTYDLRNPKHQLGSDARYPEWTLESTLNSDQTLSLVKLMQERLASTPVFPSSNQIGGKVAGDTQLMALYALLASMAIIVVYIWIRFQNVMFGLAAVLALVHDVLVTVAFLAMSYYLSPYLGFLLVDPFKISLAVVAALLTIVGFSINDTIVVFDRIREVRGKSPDLTENMINLSVNATLSRTLLTSGTVMIASVILYFVGGPGIHAFAYSMVVGVVAGTYSSIYIAAPVLLWMKRPPKSTGKPAGSIQTAAVGTSKNGH